MRLGVWQRWSSVIIAAILAVAATVWILSGQVGGKPAPTPAPAAQAPESGPMRVAVITSRAEAFRPDLEIHGRTEAERQVRIRAEVAGRVTQLPARKGAMVAAGDVLARLDPGDLPARLAEAEALVAQRRLENEAAQRLHSRGHGSTVDRARAEADLRAAEAVEARIRDSLDKTELTAPFAGVVTDLPIEIGDYLAPGDPAATVMELNPLKVVAHANEQQMARIHPGAPGRAVLITGDELRGTVAYVARSADPVTRTYQVELMVPNPGNSVPDGMTARVVLSLDPLPAHKVSPSLLVLADDGRLGVKAVVDDRAVFRPVKVVADTPDGVWLAGLPDTVTLIATGQDFVADGAPVVPVAAGDGHS